jgi:mono/diheme cytochrome c family protein
MKERFGPIMAYRMYVSMMLLGTLACRANERKDGLDTARTPETTGARAPTAAPIRDSSAGTVASTVGSGDTASVRRDAATAAPPAGAPTPAASHPADTMDRRRATEAAAAPRDTSSARPDSAARKRPPRPAPTPLPVGDTTPSSRPATSPETPQRTDSAQQQAGDKLAVNQSEYNGWKWFAVNCTRCHGEDAVGSTIAPNLMKSLREHVTHDVFVQTVKNGRPDKGMPTWEPLLTDKQIEDLYAYLKARSEGRLAPGRPHVKPEG